MLEATELYEVDTLLSFVLWIEVVVYLGFGIYEIFDDFIGKPPSWMSLGGKTNGYLFLRDKVGHKMHAGICFLLGFIALNGIMEGAVTRFELELCFLSLALLMMAIWVTKLPGRTGIFVITLTKPEFWLQIILFGFYSNLVRPEILYVCIVINSWGIFSYFFHTKKYVFKPFTYEALRKDLVEAGFEEEKIKPFDKLAGHRLKSE